MYTQRDTGIVSRWFDCCHVVALGVQERGKGKRLWIQLDRNRRPHELFDQLSSMFPKYCVTVKRGGTKVKYGEVESCRVVSGYLRG